MTRNFVDPDMPVECNFWVGDDLASLHVEVLGLVHAYARVARQRWAHGVCPTKNMQPLACTP